LPSTCTVSAVAGKEINKNNPIAENNALNVTPDCPKRLLLRRLAKV